MKTVNQAILVAILPITLLSVSGKALASGGNPIIQLPWEPKTETVEYHSCGAADACWVAQVKNRKTKKRIALLRCDGEKLFSGMGRHPETIAAENCHQFETDDKFNEITATLQTLLGR